MPENPYEPPKELNEPRLWPWRREWREKRARRNFLRFVVAILAVWIISQLFLIWHAAQFPAAQ
jgi:hypothetical protein